MQVTTFDGGLSQRVHPSLILINEGEEYNNIDNTNLLLNSAADFTDLSVTVNGYFYIFEDKYLSSVFERSYVEYNNYLYFTEQNKKARKHDGNRETNLGIDGPTEKVEIVQSDPEADEKVSESEATFQYVYTYYNSEDGIESVPSPLSDELTVVADKTISVSNILPSADFQVDKIRLYRLGDSITTFTLIEELEIETNEYTDGLLSVDLDGRILDSYNNYVIPTGARHLIEAYGIMFAAVGSVLQFSELGKPDYWPPANTIQFSADITMILPLQNGLLVCSADTADLLVGSDATTFNKLSLTSEQGSISHQSAKIVNKSPIWISKDGICTYNGNYIQVLSKDKLGKANLSVVNTAVLSEVYYVCLSDGTILAMDLRFGMTFARYTFTDKIGNILVKDSILYGRVNDTLVTLFTGDLLSMEYHSPVFIEGSHTLIKNYNNIYLRSDGEFVVKVLIDNKEVLHKTIEGNKTHDIQVPAAKQRGYGMQIVLSGKGTVYEYEFKVGARENGR